MPSFFDFFCQWLWNFFLLYLQFYGIIMITILFKDLLFELKHIFTCTIKFLIFLMYDLFEIKAIVGLTFNIDYSFLASF